MGKHIPGNPAIIVENMTGAGSLIAANYLYKIAKPDGLTLGSFHGGLFFNQLMGQPGIEFDARKFEFIGAVAREDTVYAFTKASGITSVEKWMASKTPVKMGGVSPGVHAPDNVIRIVKAAWVFLSSSSLATKGLQTSVWPVRAENWLEVLGDGNP